MTLVADVMTSGVQSAAPDTSLKQAAQWMDQLNVGSLPVCAGAALLGMVTDRDITVRATAIGTAPDHARVSDVMTREAVFCFADQEVTEVIQLMGSRQVRRIPVVDRDLKLVGIVSLGDLATRQQGDVGAAVRKISEPCEPDGTPGNS